MSNNEIREEKSVESKLVDLEEGIISDILDSMDLSELLEKDYLTAKVDLIPGKLTAKYSSPPDGEILEIEQEADELEIKDKSLRSLYGYRRSLANALVSINDTQFMPGAGVPAKLEGLKRKPKHLVDKLNWGHVLFQEALSRLLTHPEELEIRLKNS